MGMHTFHHMREHTRQGTRKMIRCSLKCHLFTPPHTDEQLKGLVVGEVTRQSRAEKYNSRTESHTHDTHSVSNWKFTLFHLSIYDDEDCYDDDEEDHRDNSHHHPNDDSSLYITRA